jgi:hypothetical protein
MSKGGARLGAGRKPKEDGLKVANFRLSIEDLKILDKKGIGKNSSEKLRYILSKFKSEKINISKRRKAYNVEKFMSFEEADLKFHKLLSYWESLDKNKFLLESNLRNDLRLKFEIKNRKALETMEYFDELKKLEWFLQDINFIWTGAELSRVDVQLKKLDYSVTLPVTNDGNEFIVKYMDEVIEETVDEIVAISLDEEDTLSYFYEDLQDILFKKNHPLNLSENVYYKKYINGDIYKTLEFDNIVVIELEYQSKDKTAVLNSIKDLISMA